MFGGGGSMHVDEELFGAYVFYGALLVLKMLIMAPLTARQRLSNKVFSNEEDAKARGGTVAVNEDVERVRRAHLNDMECIYVFLANAAFFLATKPDAWLAVTLFRVFVGTRYLHTFFYLNQVRQPTRGLSFMVGHAVQFYMVFCTLKSFF